MLLELVIATGRGVRTTTTGSPVYPASAAVYGPLLVAARYWSVLGLAERTVVGGFLAAWLVAAVAPGRRPPRDVLTEFAVEAMEVVGRRSSGCGSTTRRDVGSPTTCGRSARSWRHVMATPHDCPAGTPGPHRRRRPVASVVLVEDRFAFGVGLQKRLVDHGVQRSSIRWLDHATCLRTIGVDAGLADLLLLDAYDLDGQRGDPTRSRLAAADVLLRLRHETSPACRSTCEPSGERQLPVVETTVRRGGVVCARG